MRIKITLLLFLILVSFDLMSQCCCGKFYFRVFDNTINLVAPSLKDTALLQKNLPGKKLQLSDGFILKCTETEGNAGTAPLNLYRPLPYPDLLFQFNTGCNTSLKRIIVKKGRKKMIVNFIDIPSETIILMDSIPFVAAEVSYNLSTIITNNKLDFVENSPESKLFLHYRIPYTILLKSGTYTFNKRRQRRNDRQWQKDSKHSRPVSWQKHPKGRHTRDLETGF